MLDWVMHQIGVGTLVVVFMLAVSHKMRDFTRFRASMRAYEIIPDMFLGLFAPLVVALLNAALAQVGDSIPAAASITIDVVYDVSAGQGGNSSSVNLVATSTRVGGDTNNSTTVVTAVLSGSVSVTADNPTICSTRRASSCASLRRRPCSSP